MKEKIVLLFSINKLFFTSLTRKLLKVQEKLENRGFSHHMIANVSYE